MGMAQERLDEPRVHRDPFAGGSGFEAHLEALRQAEGDPCRVRLVGRLERRLRLVADEYEFRIAACEPDLDPPFVELAGKFERRLAKGLEEASAEGGFERAREELGGASGRLVADRSYPGEVFTERLDIAVDLHDRSMTSS